jgi:hypothetical protein
VIGPPSFREVMRLALQTPGEVSSCIWCLFIRGLQGLGEDRQDHSHPLLYPASPWMDADFCLSSPQDARGGRDSEVPFLTDEWVAHFASASKDQLRDQCQCKDPRSVFLPFSSTHTLTSPSPFPDNPSFKLITYLT